MEGSDIEFRPAGAADWSSIWPIFREAVSAGETYSLPPAIDMADARTAWVGRRFADYVMNEVRRLEYSAMQFNSVEVTNTAAIGLWKSLGFEIVGTVPDAFRHRYAGLTAVHVICRALDTT